MKVAFVGKGGSGKTTCASLFALRAAAAGAPVLALDADINQNLAVALGATAEDAAGLPTLPSHLGLIKNWLRGDNPRIPSADQMIKTTPPGRGSRLLGVVEDNPIYDAAVREVVPGVRVGLAGAFEDADLGVACFHAKTGAVELLLSHLVDGPGEYVVVDMTAGADAFASGLFTRFDLTFLVCEPTLRSVGVYRQYAGYARDFGVRLAVVGNKVADDSDVAFLRDEVGDDLVGVLGHSGHVRAGDRGAPRDVAGLEPANAAVLDDLRAAVDAVDKDWASYQADAVAMHLRNANAWAGSALAEQIDPDFVPAPATL
ncbi:ATP-binding protein [Actinomycetospora flava]|uniref:ATP-binding protein n=1 Tax=Actinomycetospora flava TaxID=3129232 RepID=A0ABU8LZ41_9PSEU